MWHKALKMAQCPELHTTTVRAPPLHKMNVSRCDAWWNVINLITHFQTANKCPAKYGPFKTWISRLTKISFILSTKLTQTSLKSLRLRDLLTFGYLWLPLVYLWFTLGLPLVYLWLPFLVLLSLPRPYWAYWALLGLTGPYWALLGLTGPYFTFA